MITHSTKGSLALHMVCHGGPVSNEFLRAFCAGSCSWGTARSGARNPWERALLAWRTCFWHKGAQLVSWSADGTAACSPQVALGNQGLRVLLGCHLWVSDRAVNALQQWNQNGLWLWCQPQRECQAKGMRSSQSIVGKNTFESCKLKKKRGCENG